MENNLLKVQLIKTTKELRLQKNLTQLDVSLKMKVSYTSISRIESLRHMPRLSTLTNYSNSVIELKHKRKIKPFQFIKVYKTIDTL